MKIVRSFCAYFVVLGCASVALAANDVWDANGLNPPTGIWGTNVNWADNTTPGNSDTAAFNLGSVYTVIFNADPLAIQALTVTGTVPTFTSSGGARTLSVTSATGGQDVTISGSVLTLGTAGNPLHMTVGDNLTVNGGALLNAFSGSQVNTLDLLLATVNGGGNGTMVVDGAGSQLNVTNGFNLAQNGNTGTLVYRNAAQGTFGGTVNLSPSSNPATASTLNVESDADLNTASLAVGNGGGAGTGTLNINGVGSTLTQSGASTLSVGTASACIGNINIGTTADGGTLTTGTGTLTINATGTVNVGITGFDGTLNANGNVTINGGTLTRSSGSSFNLADGATMIVQNGGSASFASSVTAYTTASNATYNITGGGSLLETTGGGGHLAINNGAQVSVSNLGTLVSAGTINIGTTLTGGDGTLAVDGIGSTAAASLGLESRWGTNGNTASVTFSNGASGSFGSLLLAASSGAGTTAMVDVLSDADLMIGSINLATFGGATTSATLNIQGSGSTVVQTEFTSVDVGHNSAGNAEFNIGTTASGATFTSGTGTLRILATGTVTIGSGANTGTLNANGNVSIDGGSLQRLNDGSAFNLASGATMTVRFGGSASFTSSYTTATNAIYNVSGAGSTLETVTGSLSINNAAQVNVSLGGIVSSAGNFLIGNGGNGTLTVDGSGSSLVSAGPTNSWGRVGNTATVTFSNNATGTLSGNLNLAETATANTIAVVDVLSGADLSVGGSITLAAAGVATNSATLNVQGSGSTFTQSGAGTLSVGNFTTGPAVINIGTTTDGAVLTTGTGTMAIKATGTVAIGSASTLGTLNANGNLLINGGQLIVASQGIFNLATGMTLTIDNGGRTVINRSHTIPANSIYNVTGSESELLTTGGSGTLSFGLAAELNVTSGGTASASGNLSMGSGALLVDGPGSTFTAGGTAASLSANGVNVAFSGEAVGYFPSLLLSASVGAASTVVFDVLSGADVNTALGLRVGTIIGPSASATLNVEGAGSTFTVNSAGLDAVDIGHATNGSAALNIGTTTSGGRFTSAGAIEIHPTGVVTVGSATTAGTLNANGNVTINGGTIHLVDGVVNADSITLTGGGTFDFDGGTLHVDTFTGNLVNEGGTLSPGQSPGITTVTGSYTQQNASTLQIEIGGLTPGTQYDQVLVSGALTLDGTLDVTLINGINPVLDDAFEIITAAGGVSGMFDTLAEELPALSSGLEWAINYDANNVVLQVISAALPGDFNDDDSVDAADYIVWRKSNGSQSGYNTWRSHFGQSAGSGEALPSVESLSAAVPEPATLMLMILAATVWCLGRGPIA